MQLTPRGLNFVALRSLLCPGEGELVTKLAAILDQIDSGSVLLPEFQRGYVWNRDQVRGLMRSLYRGYPVGGLLTWETHADGSLVRGEATVTRALRVLILDGQQRITSLYGITRGRPPAFFQGDEKAFSGLRFNVEDETFEFYAPAKMRDDPRWIDVTSLFTQGLEYHIGSVERASRRTQWSRTSSLTWSACPGCGRC